MRNFILVSFGIAAAVLPQRFATAAVSVSNPSFENAGSWQGLSTRGSSELFAAPHGASFAELISGSSISQTLGTIESGTAYSAVVWVRGVNAQIPATSGADKGKQITHLNLLAEAKLSLKASNGAEIASVQIIVSPNTTALVLPNGESIANAQDDGANVFIDGNYRYESTLDK